MLKVLMVASEANPFAKTGGLADVIGALAPSLRSLGHEVAVLMPRYRSVDVRGMAPVYQDLRVWFGATLYTCTLFRAVERDVSYYLLDYPPFFDRDGLYGDAAGDYPDNYLRFALLARAALTFIRHVTRPNIVHCHDWQAALVPVYMRTAFASDPTFIGPKTVFTIHNLGYQGVFHPDVMPQIGLPADLLRPDRLGFHGKINLLKGAIIYSDALTTVSRTYAREIQGANGFGLEDFLRARSEDLTGILNGVDYTQWDPANDAYIAARYSVDNLEGKRACKADLLAELGLPDSLIDTPMIGMVSRLAGQKGLDLIEQVKDELAAEDLSLVVLGSGDPHCEKMLSDLAWSNPGNIAVRIGWDERLAHKIEAGADMFLMPSLYEPCGLNQIFSLRYGTVPIVRATGGLEDTVDAETGFKFRGYTGAETLEAIRAALAAWKDRDRWTAMMRAGMRKDFSWTASAAEYGALFSRLAAGGRAAGAAGR